MDRPQLKGGYRAALSAHQSCPSGEDLAPRPTRIKPRVGPRERFGKPAQSRAADLSSENEGSADEAELDSGIEKAEGACPAGPIPRTMNHESTARNEPNGNLNRFRRISGPSGTGPHDPECGGTTGRALESS